MIIEVIESVSIYECASLDESVDDFEANTQNAANQHGSLSWSDLIQLIVQCFLRLFVDDLTGYSYFVIPNAFLITLT